MHASKFTKFKFIVRDARVFPGIWFDFIYPHNSLLLLRYLLQPVRVRFTALSCFETNVIKRVITCYFQDAAEVCKEYMKRDPNALNFTVVALSGTQ